MATNRLTWVDTARGVAIFLIVLGHTHYWLTAAGIETDAPFGITDKLAVMRLPLFFFVAGLFSVKYLEGPWRTLLNRKVLLFGWVFLVWQVINIGYSVVAGIFIHGEEAATVVLKSILKPIVSIVRPSNELWFLWALCLMFVITKLLWGLRARARIVVSLAPALAMYSLTDSVSEQLLSVVELGWAGLAQYLFLFLIAATIGTEGARRIGDLHPFLALLGVVVFVTGSVLLETINLGPGDILGPVFWLAGDVCLAVVLQRVKFLGALGKASLSVYVMHTTLLVIICAVFARLGSINDSAGLSYWLPVLMAVLVLGIARCVHVLWGSQQLRYLFDLPPQIGAQIPALAASARPRRMSPTNRLRAWWAGRDLVVRPCRRATMTTKPDDTCSQTYTRGDARLAGHDGYCSLECAKSQQQSAI